MMPNFDNEIIDAINQSDYYIDFTKYDKEFTFTDGNHLYKSSGKEVSEIMAKLIAVKFKKYKTASN